MTTPPGSPWLGWLVAVLIGALWWVAPHDEVTSTAAPAAVETRGADRADATAEEIAPGPWSKQIALLAECRASNRQARDARAACACDADGQPRAGAAVDGTAAPDPRSDDRAGDRFADAGSSVESERHALKAVLGVTDREADWLAAYLCAVDDLRSATLDDLRAAGVTSGNPDEAATERALQGARQQRSAMLDDLKTRLGQGRYAQLRSVGGLSLVGAMLDCGR